MARTMHPFTDYPPPPISSPEHEFTVEQRLKILHLLNIELSKYDSFDALCRAAVELGRYWLRFDRMALWFIDGEQAHGSFGTDEAGLTRDERDERHALPNDERFSVTLKQQSEPLVMNPATLFNHRSEPIGDGWNVLAFLTDGQRNFGYLAVDNYLHRKPLTHADVEILALYGIALAQLTRRKQAEMQLRAREATGRAFQEDLRALNQVTAALAHSTSFDNLCYRAVELGRERLKFERLGLWFHDLKDWNMLVGSFGIDERGQVRDERGIRVTYNFPGMRPIMDGRMLISIDDTHPLYDHALGEVGRGHIAAAAVWDGDVNIGWLSADNYFSRTAFPEYRLELLGLFASAIGHFATRHRIQDRSLTMAVEMAVAKERVDLLHRFITAISHDFRTPLSIINSSLYFLERAEDRAQRAARSQIVASQTALIEKYIDDVLNISRLEILETLPCTPLDLAVILDDLHAKAQRPSREKGIELRVEPPDEPLIALCDYAELTQAAFQIVQNALEYTPPGGHILLRTLRRGGMAALEIADTGSGIDRDALSQIFEPFYRADPARNPETGGTGLGLSIVRRIVELHGGYVEVESERGQGSVFRLVLPLTQ